MMATSHREYAITRRQFLLCAGAAAATAASSGCATMTIYRKAFADGRIDIDAAAHPELEEVGGRIVVDAEGLEGAVLLLNTGEVHRALYIVCTHQQCNLKPSRDFLTCGCHGSTFNLKGEVVRGPATRRLPSFRTERNDSTITILIDD